MLALLPFFLAVYLGMLLPLHVEAQRDEPVYLEGENATLAQAAGSTATVHQSSYIEVALQKQYVPVMKGAKHVAYKTAYFGHVYLGSPSSEFSVVFDTGSGHLILPSTFCTSPACTSKRRYDRAASSSGIDVDSDGTVVGEEQEERDQLTVAFGTGEVFGEFVQEDVCLREEGNDICTALRFVVAVEMTDDPFGLFQFDGVLGLGLEALTIDPHFSFFSQFAGRHPEMSAVFAVYLSRHDGGENIISFGGYNESRLSSEIKWSPVARSELGYWQVQIKHVRIGDEVLDECEHASCYAVLDTGTSQLGVPRGMLRTMHRGLARPVAQATLLDADDIDCRNIPGAPIHFDLGDHIVTLGVEDHSRPQPFNMSRPPDANGEGASWKLFCRSLLLPVDMEEPIGPRVFLWGEPVLRRYNTMFDGRNQRIGFSEARRTLGNGAKSLPTLGAPLNSKASGVGIAKPIIASPPGAAITNDVAVLAGDEPVVDV